MKYSHLRKIFIAAAVWIFFKSTADVQPSTVVISISAKIMMLQKKRKMMNCGEEVEIVNYYNYTDIDVRFPDGYIKRHAQYTNFKRGGISRPTSERLMETRVMKDGNKATIIAYCNCNNIDVQFENGCVRKHVRYEKFKIGEIYVNSSLSCR